MLELPQPAYALSTEQLGPSPQNHRAKHELHRAARCSVRLRYVYAEGPKTDTNVKATESAARRREEGAGL